MKIVLHDDTFQFAGIAGSLPWLFMMGFFFEIKEAGYMFEALVIVTVLSIVMFLTAFWFYTRK